MISLFASVVAVGQPVSVIWEDGFESTNLQTRWFPTDAEMWTVDDRDGNHVLHLHGKSQYNPSYRSPHSIILLKDAVVGDFALRARVKALQTSRGQRDRCISSDGRMRQGVTTCILGKRSIRIPVRSLLCRMHHEQ